MQYLQSVVNWSTIKWRMGGGGWGFEHKNSVGRWEYRNSVSSWIVGKTNPCPEYVSILTKTKLSLPPGWKSSNVTSLSPKVIFSLLEDWSHCGFSIGLQLWSALVSIGLQNVFSSRIQQHLQEMHQPWWKGTTWLLRSWTCRASTRVDRAGPGWYHFYVLFRAPSANE